MSRPSIDMLPDDTCVGDMTHAISDIIGDMTHAISDIIGDMTHARMLHLLICSLMIPV